MKTRCCNCNKEFELGFIKSLAYALEDSMEFECDRCIFDKVFDKLDKDFIFEIYDEDNKQFKSLDCILSELGNRWHKDNLKIENKSYGSKEVKR